MPNSKDYLKGFGVFQGMKIANFTLSSIGIEHRQIVRYREYEYPMRLVFSRNLPENSGDRARLLSEFSKHVSGGRVIYTSYGNPYTCDFGVPRISGSSNAHVIIESIGHSYRI